MNKGLCCAFAAFLALLGTTPGRTQFYPPGLCESLGAVPVPGGGGTECRCPDGSNAGINGCPNLRNPNWQPPPSRYQPAPPQTYNAPPSKDPHESAVLRMFNFLASSVSAGTQEYTDQIGGLSKQLPQGNIASPPNPDAARALAALIGQPVRSGIPQPSGSPAALSKPGQLVDPFTGRAVQLRPATPSNQPPRPDTAPGSYSACAGSSTFGGPKPSYCEMGDYIYFQNGAVLRAK